MDACMYIIYCPLCRMVSVPSIQQVEGAVLRWWRFYWKGEQIPTRLSLGYVLVCWLCTFMLLHCRTDVPFLCVCGHILIIHNAGRHQSTLCNQWYWLHWGGRYFTEVGSRSQSGRQGTENIVCSYYYVLLVCCLEFLCIMLISHNV